MGGGVAYIYIYIYVSSDVRVRYWCHVNVYLFLVLADDKIGEVEGADAEIKAASDQKAVEVELHFMGPCALGPTKYS